MRRVSKQRSRQSKQRRKSTKQRHKRSRSKQRRKRSKSKQRRKSMKQRRKSRRTDGMNDVKLYNNPSILPVPLELCYKDSINDIVACKYKLTEESNPFVITFPGSEKFYEDLSKYRIQISKNIYKISLDEMFSLKGLTVQKFISQLQPGFTSSVTSPTMRIINYDINDLKIIDIIKNYEEELYNGNTILNESVNKKRYDITCFLLNNYIKETSEVINSEFINILIKPNPELEIMFQEINELFVINKNKIFNKTDILLVIVCFFTLFYMIRDFLKIFNKNYLTDSITRNSYYIPKLLIYFGADINANSPFSRTPLTKALSEKNFIISKYLIEKGADVNKCWLEGDTMSPPLSWAINTGNFEMVKLLIDNGAIINRTDGINKRYIPLHKIIQKINDTEIDNTPIYGDLYKIAEYLLERGANENTRDNTGRTARDINPEIYTRVKRRVYQKSVDKIETIATAFTLRDAEPRSERRIEEMELEAFIKYLEEMEMPEAFIEYLKKTGTDPGFAIAELLKFFDNIDQ